MRITRQHVEAKRKEAPDEPRTPRRWPSLPTLWLVVALAGALLAVIEAGQWAVAGGLVLLAVGSHRLGLHEGRRAQPVDPAALLSHARQAARLEAARIVAAAADLDGGAGDARGALDAAPPVQPRPSEGVRGGGRPGVRAPLRAIETSPLDRALDGADA